MFGDMKIILQRMWFARTSDYGWSLLWIDSEGDSLLGTLTVSKHRIGESEM